MKMKSIVMNFIISNERRINDSEYDLQLMSAESTAVNFISA